MEGTVIADHWEHMLIKSFFFSLFLWSLSAWAWEPTFGSEFNLKSNSIVTDLWDKKEQFSALVSKRCPDCRIEARSYFGKPSNVVFHPDGWNFTISLDTVVIEVLMGKSTVPELKANVTEIQRLIFDVANDIGLKPTNLCGHVHIGLDAFEHDPLFFRNFLVDRMLYSEMFFSAFRGSMLNGPPIGRTGPLPLLYLRDVIQQFDEQVLKMDSHSLEFDVALTKAEIPRNLFAQVPRESAIEALMDAVNQYVYVSHPFGMRAEKHQAVNLWHPDTWEDRSVPEANSAYQFVDLTSLKKARLAYVRKMKSPLPFAAILPAQNFEIAKQLLSQYATQAEYPAAVAIGLMKLPRNESAADRLRRIKSCRIAAQPNSAQ